MKKLTMDDGSTYILLKEEEFNKPTAEQVMRHLLTGGWVEDRDYKNASYFVKLDSSGNLECRFKRDDEKQPKKGWEKWHLTFADYEMKDWRLIQPFKFEDEK